MSAINILPGSLSTMSLTVAGNLGVAGGANITGNLNVSGSITAINVTYGGVGITNPLSAPLNTSEYYFTSSSLSGVVIDKQLSIYQIGNLAGGSTNLNRNTLTFSNYTPLAGNTSLTQDTDGFVIANTATTAQYARVTVTLSSNPTLDVAPSSVTVSGTLNACNITVGGNPIVTGISAGSGNLSGLVQFLPGPTNTITISAGTGNQLYFDASIDTSLSNWSSYGIPVGSNIFASNENTIQLSGDTFIQGSSKTQLFGAALFGQDNSSIPITTYYTQGYDTAFIQVWGAGGGRSVDQNTNLTQYGGAGGYIECTVPLASISTSTFNISIGGPGANGSNIISGNFAPGGYNGGGNGGTTAATGPAGAGGGGASTVFVDTNLIAIAGGGGGAAPFSASQAIVVMGGPAGGFSNGSSVGGSITSQYSGYGASNFIGGSGGLFTLSTSPGVNAGGTGATGINPPTSVAAGGNGGNANSPAGLSGGGGGAGWGGGGGGGVFTVAGWGGGGGTSYVNTSIFGISSNVTSNGTLQVPIETDQRVPGAGFGGPFPPYHIGGSTSGAFIVTFYSASAANIQSYSLDVCGGVHAVEYTTNTIFIPSLAANASAKIFPPPGPNLVGSNIGSYMFTGYSLDESGAIVSAPAVVGYFTDVCLGAQVANYPAANTLQFVGINLPNDGQIYLSNASTHTFNTIYARYTKLG
jgi:hypothetical protein